MFDNQVSTVTTSTSPLTVEVKPGKAINSAAFLNLTGNSLEVTMTDGLAGPVIFNETVNLDDTIILDWYGYFFEEYSPKTEVVFTNLPLYANCYLSMTLTGTSNVSIGLFTYGSAYDLGGTQYGASSGIIDYSVKQTDEYGNTSFVQRAYSKRMEASTFMPNNALSFNQRLLAGLRATPVVWIGSEDEQYKPLIVFGFYKDFSIDITYPTYSLCRLTIEGLT